MILSKVSKYNLLHQILCKNIFYIVALVIFIILYHLDFLKLTIPYDKGDAYGYLNFNFNNLENIFSNYRSIGFPFLIKIYTFFFKDNFSFLPFIFFFLYIHSIYFLKNSINKKNETNLFLELLFIGLLLNSSFLNGLKFIETESVSNIIIIYILSFLFRYLEKLKFKHLFLLSLFLLFSVLIRANLIVLYGVVFILFILEIYRIKIKNKLFLFLKFNTILVFPLVCFLILRYSIIGTVGLAEMNGVVISGHAIASIQKNYDISLYNEMENNYIKNALSRINQLDSPCNDVFKNYENQQNCGNVLIMTAWLAAINSIDDTKDLDLNPWKSQDISKLLPQNNLIYNQFLKKVSSKILFNNFTNYLNRFIHQFSYAIYKTINKIYRNSYIHLFIVLNILAFIYYYIFNQKVIESFINKIGSKIFITHLLFYFSTIILISLLMHFDYRYINMANIFLLPAIQIITVFIIIKFLIFFNFKLKK